MTIRNATLNRRYLDPLEAADEKTLAAWWSSLNRHEWPEGLPKMEVLRWPIMSWIMSEIGYKECLRDWNKETMDDEAFEDWWKRRPRMAA